LIGGRGFETNRQQQKWGKLSKISDDTALRDIQDLIEKGILQQQKQAAPRARSFAKAANLNEQL
jgi:Fic family protein